MSDFHQATTIAIYGGMIVIGLFSSVLLVPVIIWALSWVWKGILYALFYAAMAVIWVPTWIITLAIWGVLLGCKWIGTQIVRLLECPCSACGRRALAESLRSWWCDVPPGFGYRPRRSPSAGLWDTLGTEGDC